MRESERNSKRGIRESKKEKKKQSEQECERERESKRKRKRTLAGRRTPLWNNDHVRLSMRRHTKTYAGDGRLSVRAAERRMLFCHFVQGMLASCDTLGVMSWECVNWLFIVLVHI